TPFSAVARGGLPLPVSVSGCVATGGGPRYAGSFVRRVRFRISLSRLDGSSLSAIPHRRHPLEVGVLRPRRRAPLLRGRENDAAGHGELAGDADPGGGDGQPAVEVR